MTPISEDSLTDLGFKTPQSEIQLKSKSAGKGFFHAMSGEFYVRVWLYKNNRIDLAIQRFNAPKREGVYLMYHKIPFTYIEQIKRLFKAFTLEDLIPTPHYLTND